MGQEELMNIIAELECEIAILPEGSITMNKRIFYEKICGSGMDEEYSSLCGLQSVACVWNAKGRFYFLYTGV